MARDKPRLRTDLDPAVSTLDGREVVLLRDPLELSTQVIALGRGVLPLLGLLDGTRDMPALRLEAVKRSQGSLHAAEDVEKLVEVLDERFLLDDDRYRGERRKVVDAWCAAEVRPSALAGRAYPADPDDLARSIGEVLDHAPELSATMPQGKLVALAVPHIDLKKGWPLYAAAYSLLERTGTDAKRIPVLGTGHALFDPAPCPTSKHYETPLGVARTDAPFVGAFAGTAAGGADDMAHRREHSIEMQVIFLQHVLGTDMPPLVPILCGPPGEHLVAAARPRDLPGAGKIADLLGGAMRDPGGALAIASVDLCHIGPQFGDEKRSSDLLPGAIEHESALIDAAVRADPVAFWTEARRVGDAFHVCGLTALGLLLEILPSGTVGALLGRDVMREPETGSAVGFASIAFFAPRDDRRGPARRRTPWD